jgi:ubiquinone/menaquinone biosynthesis C-methylase UbiE/acyl carrier protein
MAESGSYDIQNFAVDKNKEILRLNAQIDLFWEQEYSFYRRLGLSDGMKVLDCGCGPGYLLEKLLTLFPSISCTGVEISEFLYTTAIDNITTKRLDRCSVYNQSILNIELPDNTFDFVIVRLVLEHLPDPIAAMREVFRVLKVGGQAVFIDNDFDFHVHTYPEVPELVDLYKAYCDARIHDGGNPRIGRQLPHLLSVAGYSDIVFETIAAHNSIAGDQAFLHSEGSGIALQLLRDGYLASPVYDRLALHWSTMLKTREHSIIRLLFAGSGKKAASASFRSIDTSSTSIVNKHSSNSTATQKNSTNLPEIDSVSNLRSIVAEILEISFDKVSPQLTLGSLGLDSVGAVMLKNHLENTLKVIVPSLDYLNCHTISDLSLLIGSTADAPDKKETDVKESSFEEGEI